MNDRIVVIDGHAMNPGDLSWDNLEALGDLTVYDRSALNQVDQRLADATCVLTNKVPFDDERLARLPKLRYIGVTATGYNIIDTTAAARRGVVVTNVPAYSRQSVAEHVIGLLLELARNLRAHVEAGRIDAWSNAPDFSVQAGPLVELHGKTLGIVGFGQIGSAVARIAHAMGMRLIVANRSKLDEERKAGLPIEQVLVDQLFAEADVVSLHCPLTAETEGLVSGDRLATMKQSAWLINTGRGQLIDNQALADALREGRIAGAALDVLEQEPPPADHPLREAPHCLITPHVAWCAREARQRLLQTSIDNLRAFQQGSPINLVGQPGD